jgi:hypothetical protein
VKLDMKHTGAQPLRKILEKTLNLTDEHQDYIITIYAGDIMSSLIKDKEITIIDGIIRAFPVKISLINQKNKFDSYINPSVDKDFFIPFVKFFRSLYESTRFTPGSSLPTRQMRALQKNTHPID